LYPVIAILHVIEKMKTKYIWIFSYFAFLIWSGVNPKDRFTWFLEVVPALAGFCVLVLTYHKFRLTPLLYFLILIHCIILMIGGHYTYAEVPFFNYISDTFGWGRNNFDKLGHFAQGFVPALIARELIIRKTIINGPVWQSFFTVCFCLALSAFYELVEWWVALAVGQDADAFLGTQGYIWDTQSDMEFALFGAITGLLVLGKYHSRQIASVST